MSDEKKTGVQEAFKHGQIECVVATIAFGMVSPALAENFLEIAKLMDRVLTRPMSVMSSISRLLLGSSVCQGRTDIRRYLTSQPTTKKLDELDEMVM